ncbi:hypothetical protein BU26DRAFT_566501 [Trematosphaeria pertusa]|uniref:Uncharacterized protein n=1 Tax=Trematosphaeria pertusa TaxID=390896 RepID=A0A6A6ICA0_9PLEO|nr:uncharacterized protein BU26DRAFT_566501 [Trematosphaeria pertusa]KAF2247532.1 hypothetical protein BU26DRAFT_566501 [Trematosphaeria pertusa]
MPVPLLPPQHPKTTPADLLSSRFVPIQKRLLSHLSIAEIAALKQTSKAFADMSSTLNATDYNINTKLKKFFSDPKAFRSVQANCNALLGGLFAQRFFARDKELPDKIEIYVQTNKVRLLRDYLIAEGYKDTVPAMAKPEGSESEPDPDSHFNAEEEEEDSEDPDKSPGKHFKKDTAAGKQVHMQLNWSGNPPIYKLLTEAPTTAALNFLSWNRAYALFPSTTFIQKDVYLLLKLDDAMGEHLAQLAEHGLHTKSVHWNQREREGNAWCALFAGNSDIMTRLRRVGDKYTWTIDLDTNGVVSETPAKVLEQTTFKLQLPGKQWPDAHEMVPVPRYMMGPMWWLRCPVLKHGYVAVDDSIGDENIPHSKYRDKVDSLIDRLRELTMIELVKIPKDKRPSVYAPLRDGQMEAEELCGRFELPESWSFYDDDVLRFLEEAWADEQVQELVEASEKVEEKPDTEKS